MQILHDLAERHFRRHLKEGDIQTLAFGASGRTIARIRLGERTCIGIIWGNDRADNDAFVPVARHLKAHGVHVPEIYDYEPLAAGCGAALTEDLGDTNLLSLLHESWPALRDHYVRAMEQLYLLHQCPFPEDFSLQPAFDEGLYRWEQEYFAEHFLGTHLGMDAAAFLAHPATTAQTRFLNALPRTPMHRDSQSQNIHLHAGKMWLIDFQGMRGGRPEYDLASLLYDGYTHLPPEQIDTLLDDWEAVTGSHLDRDIFQACAFQRLMQMLGAYANIGHNMGKLWYLEQIPAGLEHLRRLLPASALAEAMHGMV